MVKVTYEEIYAALSYHVWKRGRQIQEELAASKGIDSLKIFGGIGPGHIYPKLYKLQREGWIESREAQLTEEELAIRHGNRAWEYRKISGRDYTKKPRGVLGNLERGILQPA